MVLYVEDTLQKNRKFSYSPNVIGERRCLGQYSVASQHKLLPEHNPYYTRPEKNGQGLMGTLRGKMNRNEVLWLPPSCGQGMERPPSPANPLGEDTLNISGS